MSSRAERGTVLALAVAVAFLILRIAVLAARDPFFDELFTVWLAGKPFSAIVPALLNDSGPPLYYFVARFPSVTAERVLSIAIASVPLFVLLHQKRWVAALLLSFHPAAAILSAAARPYALAGALIAIAILLLERERLGGAAAAFVAAAYTHFAAAFFLPLLLLARVSWRRRIAAGAIAAIAFLPGLLLALRQPREATAWMPAPDPGGLLNSLAFIGDDPGPPLWLMAGAFALTIVAGARSWRRAALALLPLALCLGVTIFRPAYFPIRFASLLGFPIALWLAESLERWPPLVRRGLTAALVLTGLGSIFAGVVEHMRRPMSDYRVAAIELRRNAPPDEPIVATGYLYLESVHQFGEERVQAFPPEQAIHPGWRVPPRGNVNTALLPRTSFLWIGERRAPELDAIRRERRVAVLFANERAAILRVE